MTIHPKGTARRWLATLAAVLFVLGGCNKSSDSTTASIGSPAPGASTSTTAVPLPSTKPADDPNHPRVVLQTNLGNITLELDAAKAPLTVQNFLGYVSEGFYDQTIFHQAVKGKVVLGGTYDADLKEKKAHPAIRNEAHNGLKNERGTVGMARQADAVDSATSQFFLNLGDNAWLDYRDRTLEGYGYCVFGRVVEGMDIVERMGDAEVSSTPQSEQMPVQKIVLKSARRVR